MTFTLALSFQIQIPPVDDATPMALAAHPTEGTDRLRRQQALLDAIAANPTVARALAAHIALDQAHNAIGDHLTDLLGVANDDLYHVLRPAIARLPIEDQEVYVDAEIDGSFYEHTGLLVDGWEVDLLDATLTRAR